MPLEPHHLDVNEFPAAHPCADPALYHADIALLNYLLQDLRVLVRKAATGHTQITPYQSFTWDVHGLKRRTVVCDPDALLDADDVLMVGFFGDRRQSGEAAEVDTAELDVIGEFARYPGILSYSSIELINDQWANLVVHRHASDRTDWRASQVHIEAAEDLAPLVYHSVRIHNGCIPSGPIGSGTVIIESTKYWDYDAAPTWHAVRTLPGGATETLTGSTLEPA
ncbi:MAG: hypothetical protein AAF567_03875 [Actinomycetota bacterium]